MKTVKLTKFTTLLTILLLLNACASVGNVLNPFSEPPSPVAFKGEPNDHALGGSGPFDTARQALEQMASYQRAHTPQPVKPVMQPAVVRIMWIPDHLNSHGDLVPAHYYYLKVLKERWAVQDAFELESQLGNGESKASNVPYVNSNESP
ncbi:MAG: hypothetical protein D6719_02620 [Candidatus Dadabacteria bacterium]|nr:MAG: hypothetical protein D6719_02620 [Candidatus Dadabacteria bacterium]